MEEKSKQGNSRAKVPIADMLIWAIRVSLIPGGVACFSLTILFGSTVGLLGLLTPGILLLDYLAREKILNRTSFVTQLYIAFRPPDESLPVLVADTADDKKPVLSEPMLRQRMRYELVVYRFMIRHNLREINLQTAREVIEAESGGLRGTVAAVPSSDVLLQELIQTIEDLQIPKFCLTEGNRIKFNDSSVDVYP